MAGKAQRKLSEVFGKALDPHFEELLRDVFLSAATAMSADGIDFADGSRVPVVRAIPRFIPTDQYVGSFSFQWSTYTTTQLDSTQNSNLTERDLINKTLLKPGTVKGKLILDAGVGIGRHAEILARWGAYVVGIDLSDAVEAARDNLASYPTAVVMQADIANLPFRAEAFDLVVSIGVLHHTPNTRVYAEHLMPLVRPGGELSIWVYPPAFSRRAEWVPLVSLLPRLAFKEWSEWMVDVARDHRGNPWLESVIRQFPFATHHPTRERSVLALFDGFTPTYHWTHEPQEVAAWFRDGGFVDIAFHPVPTSVSGRKPISVTT